MFTSTNALVSTFLWLLIWALVWLVIGVGVFIIIDPEARAIRVAARKRFGVIAVLFSWPIFLWEYYTK